MSEPSEETLPLSRADLESAVLHLGNRDGAVRTEAERVVKQAGVEAIEPLVAVLHRELKAHRKRRRMGVVGMSALFLSFIAAALRYHFAPRHDYWFLFMAFVVFAVGMSFSIGITLPSWMQRRTSAILLGIDDIRAIPPLTDILHSSDGPNTAESQKVKGVLIALLKRLRASDIALIGEPQRAHFHQVLRHWEHFQLGPDYGTDYIVAVLKSLEQIGDARDLPFVERIAYADRTRHAADTGLHWLRKGYNAFQDFNNNRRMKTLDKPRIVQAALECLPYLQIKAEQQRVSNSLLRASDPDTDKSVVLLRPATGHESLEPQTLLRAGSGGVENDQ